MRAWPIALLIVLAGCLSPSEPAGTTDTSDDTGIEPQVHPDPVVVTGTGTVVASAGVLSSTQGGGEITVTEDMSVLYVEWAWDDPVVDLDGALSSPSAGETQGVANIDFTAPGGAPGAPDSPHSLRIELPEPGVWTISMTANGAAAATDYRFAATGFYNQDVPEGYTAL